MHKSTSSSTGQRIHCKVDDKIYYHCPPATHILVTRCHTGAADVIASEKKMWRAKHFHACVPLPKKMTIKMFNPTFLKNSYLTTIADSTPVLVFLIADWSLTLTQSYCQARLINILDQSCSQTTPIGDLNLIEKVWKAFI